jgi:hypothetical protein
MDGCQRNHKTHINGKFYLKMVQISSDGERHEHYLVEGEVQNIHNVLWPLINQPKAQ